MPISVKVPTAARMKGLNNTQTIYNNKKKFDWTEDNLIIINKKFNDWQPGKNSRRKVNE